MMIPFAVVLAHHLANLHASGAEVPTLLARASADGPLPSEHAAAALDAPVDLVPESALRPDLRGRVHAEAVSL